MSTTIDEKIVSMKFDNKQFESNVQTSLGTLDRLKRSLKLEDAARGFDNLNDASKKLNFNPLSSGIEAVTAKFSALEVMAVTALANITNSVVNAGKRFASAFTIEPIKSGLQEYETQINAIQTILANTSSKGTTLEDVNGALDELNRYADKTIYNFTEMTRNIGTFTAAGIDLKTSTSAIQGIANLAAVSGSTSQQASTAMYQLSQALASGTVKLQDWNSVVNAGMGGQVFQDALKKTAKVHGVNVDAIIEKEGSFRESLKEGWITAEILTETLSKMTKSGATEYLSELTGISQEQIEAAQKEVETNKDGSASYEKLAETMAETGKVSKEEAIEILKMADTAENAATKVKTFTQLMDTLKEAAQSGWTQTWEILIGDFDKAKELWTGVSDYFSEVINKSAEARNNMLEGWAKGGGRDMAIESIKNAFEGLLSVIKPIKDAFREVFPPMTSERLLEITKGIKELTEKMKLSESQQEKLKSTFKGLFSLIDIGVTFIKKFVGGIIELIKHVSGIGDKFLDISGNLGDLISGFRDNIKETDIFGKAINKVVDFLKMGIDKIKEFYGILKEKIPSPSLEGFLNLMYGIWGFIQKVGSKIGEVFSAIGEGLASAFNNGNLSKGLDLVNGGLLAGLLLNLKNLVSDGGIKDILETLIHPIESIKDALSPTTSMLDELKGCLQAWQKDLQANVLLKIAGAIGILTVSLLILSTIDQTKLNNSIMAITALFADLMGAMAIFGKMDTMQKGAIKASGMMIAMSISILIMTTALKKMSSLNMEEIGRGLLGILGLTAIIVQATKSLSEVKGKAMKGALNMILFAAAIKILVSACESLSTLSWEELAKGLSGSVILMYVLTECANKMSKSKGLISAGIGLIAFATGIRILATSVMALSSLSWTELAKGLSSTVIMMYMLSACMKSLSDTKGLISAGIGIIAFSTGILILSSAVKNLANMSWEEIGRGLVALAGSLAAITIAVNLMPKNMLLIGIGLLTVSAGLLVMANALQNMGSMSWEEIGRGLTALAGSLAILAIALNLMTGTLAGSAALLIASAALAILAPVLAKLGELSLSELGMALLTLAGTFAVLGVAGLLLGPLIPTILGLSGALALIGIGIAAVGVGLALISFGLSTLAVSGSAGAMALVASLAVIVTGILNLIPAITLALGNIILAICQVIITCAPAIGMALTALILALCQVIIDCSPSIVEAILVLLEALYQGIADHLPNILQAGFDILNALLDGISQNIGSVAEKAVDVIESLLTAIGEQLPRLVNAGVDLVVNIINGLADGLEQNAEKVHDAIKNLVDSLIDAFCALLGIHSPSTVFAEYGGNIIDGLVNGIKNFISKPVQTIKNLGKRLVETIGSKVSSFLSKGKELASNLGKGIKNKSSEVKEKVTGVVKGGINAISSKASEFLTKGKELMSKLSSGIKNKLSDVKAKAKEVASGALNSVKEKLSSFKDVGKDMMEGLGNGIKDAASEVVNKAKGVVNDALEGAKKLLGINSPSKEFKKIGMYSDEGLIIGLDTYKDKVYAASMRVGKASIDGMSKAISSISKVINDDIDDQPTIRPVIDLDNVANGINSIDNMLNQKRSINVLADVGTISSMMNSRQNGVNNDDVITAINKIGKKLDNASGNTYTINGVTYDDGSSISDAVKALIRAAKIERRV